MWRVGLERGPSRLVVVGHEPRSRERGEVFVGQLRRHGRPLRADHVGGTVRLALPDEDAGGEVVDGDRSAPTREFGTDDQTPRLPERLEGPGQRLPCDGDVVPGRILEEALDPLEIEDRVGGERDRRVVAVGVPGQNTAVDQPRDVPVNQFDVEALAVGVGNDRGAPFHGRDFGREVGDRHGGSRRCGGRRGLPLAVAQHGEEGPSVRVREDVRRGRRQLEGRGETHWRIETASGGKNCTSILWYRSVVPSAQSSSPKYAESSFACATRRCWWKVWRAMSSRSATSEASLFRVGHSK